MRATQALCQLSYSPELEAAAKSSRPAAGHAGGPIPPAPRGNHPTAYGSFPAIPTEATSAPISATSPPTAKSTVRSRRWRTLLSWEPSVR